MSEAPDSVSTNQSDASSSMLSSSTFNSNNNNGSTAHVITNVRYDRSRIMAEAQQLANRIRLLKSEEAKALKRVQNTKARARKLLVAREEMAKSLQARKQAVAYHNRMEQERQVRLFLLFFFSFPFSMHTRAQM